MFVLDEGIGKPEDGESIHTAKGYTMSVQVVEDEDEFALRIMKMAGESFRQEMRDLAIKHGLDPDKMVASCKLYAFIGPEPDEPNWKG